MTDERARGTAAGNGAGTWWLVVSALVALVGGVVNAWDLAHLLTGASWTRWIVTGCIALVGLAATLVALFRVPGPRTAAVVLADVALFVAGGALLLDAAVVLFLTYIAHGLSAPVG